MAEFMRKGENRMRHWSKPWKIVFIAVCSIVLVIVLLISAFCIYYASRFKTMASIERVTDYEDGYNIYSMDVSYDYDLDRLIGRGITDTQSFINAAISEALPLLPVEIKAPSFSCSAFGIATDDGDVLMGRNYDFRKNTSAMLVYCTPSDGYKSVGFAALDNIGANTADASLKTKLASLAAPFVCLDGMNEKGVTIAVLTLDSEPTVQDTEKPNISTTLAIRLVLDRAATTEEAIELLRSYDMIASSNRDYHFYINDASGDGRVVEWDCHSETRELVATPVRTVTNFFTIYADKVTEAKDNGQYGHGKDRYNKIEKVFEEATGMSSAVAWEALIAASQLPQEGSVTSNTQWSIVFNNTDKTLQIVLRRHWEEIYDYDLSTDTLLREKIDG